MRRPSCEAEVGRPGSWHLCGRPATIRIWTGRVTLCYCDRHEDRATGPNVTRLTPAKDA